MSDPSVIIEQHDALRHLVDLGFGRLLAALSSPSCYTRGGQGRLVLSKVARRLRMTPRRAAQALHDCREALQ